MRLTPERRLYGLGAILLLALAICSRMFSEVGKPSFLIWLAVGGIAYLLAVRELFSNSGFPRRVVVIGLVLAGVWHLLFLLQPPGPDDDIHRYLWDGRVQRLGYNPYLLVPNDPLLAGLHTPDTRTMNHPDVPTPYPAGAELFFRGIAAIHESIFALKVAFVLCDLAIVLLLLDLLHRNRQAEHWVLVYAWNPVLAIEVAGNGHVDILGALLLLVSLAALWRRWRAVAAVAFGAAVAVKLLPIVLVPLFWRRLRIRDALLGAGIFALLYSPFLEKGRMPMGSLGTFLQSFRFNDPLFALTEGILTPQFALALALLAGLSIAIWIRTKWPASSGAVAWPMAASLLCAPVVYPWYLLWLLPFLRSASTIPLIIWTVSIIPTYYVWHLRRIGQLWLTPGWVMLLEYGSVAMAGAIVVLRRVARPATSDARDDSKQSARAV